MKNRLVVILALLISSGVEANSKETSKRNSKYQYSESNRSTDSGDIELTQEEKALAKQWMLTESDWKKYKSIMNGPRGVWSPGLDPVTALGVSEIDITERKRYAEIWTRVFSQKYELELKFEKERMAAAVRFHQDKSLIDNEQWIEDWKAEHQGINQKVSLFIRDDCIDDCRAYFDDVRGALGKRAVLDIYFAEGASADSIGNWAQAMDIDPNVVSRKKITLNFDNGTSDIMGVPMIDLPKVRVLDVPTGKVTEAFVE